MIVVRNIYYLKFGKAKDARALFAENKDLMMKYRFENSRLLTDLVTSHSYTLIYENTWGSLTAWEGAMKTKMGQEDWQKWYQKFIPLCESAYREILNIVEL